jgi:hypothetical protein
MNSHRNQKAKAVMTTQHLSHVTLETLENYRNAAAQGILACHSGGRRLIGAVNGALQHSVYPRTAKLAPRATEFMNGVRGNVSQLVTASLDQSAAGATTAIEFGANTAGTQLNKLVQFTATMDSPVVANGLQTVARLTMPGAKVALAISGKLAAGATALADAAGAHPVRRAARKAAAAPRRAVQRAAKAAQAPLAKARRTAGAAKKAVVKRAARA